MRLERRGAIITGGTGALGRAVTTTLLSAGARVVVSYIVESEVDLLLETVGGPQPTLHPVRADVTREPDVEDLVRQALERLGHIDILVNAVGGWAGGQKVPQVGLDTWEQQMALNLKSAFLMCRKVFPPMIEQNYGRIVSVSSRAAVRPGIGQAPYNISKAGINSLTETIAEETKGYDICVNAVMPSVVDTEANRRAMPDADFSKWVKPDEIARVVLFLVSEDARPISGAAIPVYGKA